MNPLKLFLRALTGSSLSLLGALVLLTACGVNQTPTPSIPPPPRETATPSATSTPPPSPTPVDFFVSILNRRLTRAELVEQIRNEGSVTVGGWNYAASDAMTKQFQEWVKRDYGVDIKLQYVAEQAPNLYLTKLDAAQDAGQPAPYDVVAIEENYYLDAQARGGVEKMFPSDLLKEAARVDPTLHREPYAIAFQSSATVAPIFHNAAVGKWFQDWKDLADPRLRRRITLPAAGDVIAGAFLMGLAGSLGKDYKTAEGMRETIEFVCTEIQPNVWKYTSNFPETQALLRENRIDVAVNWNLLARLEGLSGADGTDDIVYRPMASGQPALNGYAWIPKGAAHPVLAQLFINWRLSDAGQFPDEAWDISKPAWGEYHEGLLGESYTAAIPEWIEANYSNYYPPVAAVQSLYKPVDWGYYAEHAPEWMEQYSKCAS